MLFIYRRPKEGGHMWKSNTRMNRSYDPKSRHSILSLCFNVYVIQFVICSRYCYISTLLVIALQQISRFCAYHCLSELLVVVPLWLLPIGIKKKVVFLFCSSFHGCNHWIFWLRRHRNILLFRNGLLYIWLRQMSSLDPSTGFTCVACHLVFKTADLQRDHYRTDWHRYNLKRQVGSHSLSLRNQSDFRKAGHFSMLMCLAFFGSNKSGHCLFSIGCAV